MGCPGREAGAFLSGGWCVNTKDFLTRVTARLDEILICVLRPDASGKNPRGFFWNRGSFAKVDDAAAAALRWDADPNNTVYFTVGAFANHAYINDKGKTAYSRKQDQATWFKALALDLDIGPDKPYATQKEGWAALRAAIDTIGLPQPMVVSSGYGIHCYWPMTEPIEKAHWVKASTALRVALDQQGVAIDTSKIHDPSMVLRPVGTMNKKQAAHKPVECKLDCPDYDPVALLSVLKPWFSQLPKTSSPDRKATRSSIASSVLNSNDVQLDVVAQHCRQVRALVESGGVYDAAGRDVQEPLWRASLGLAKHAVDVPQAVIMIAGKHPDFDLDKNMAKLAGWHGTGPTTCVKFEQLCSEGCQGCPHRSKVTSPAQLTASTTSTLTVEDGSEIEIELPKNYVEKDGKIWKEVKTEIEEVDANGNKVAKEVVEWELVSPYPMHITGVFKDPESTKSTFRLAIKYPMTGWQEEDHDIGVLASIGKDFSTFMLHRQVFSVKAMGQQEKLRGYLMDYLTMVQSAAPTGVDYVAFGWQPDGSFLCGERVLGSATGHTDRRLRGPASHFADLIGPHGDREKWIDAMRMLNEPGSQTIRAAILIATSGILGPVAGNASMVLSVYSTETTTGKSLALIAANSLIGTPKQLFMNKNDSVNALFKIRGVLNNLPCTIDELTSADDNDVVDLAYDLSQGREKRTMTRDRDLRKPVVWDGPTLITTNISLHQKFETAQANNDPLKARTMELHHHDRTFIQTDEKGSSNGYRFFDIVAENNGWAFPELVEAVLAMGGPKEVWAKGEAAFNRKFNFLFEPQERYYRTAIIAGWVISKIGERLGLFPFDVDGTAQHLINHVVDFRKKSVENKLDVFDIVGQFLQEHNDRLIEVTEVYGSGKEQVRQPAPERAVARLKVVYDSNTPVMPGSLIAINITLLKQWLARSRDAVDRLVRELEDNGALIAARERVTMFKGCSNRNPGQAHCLIINANHPRFAAALTSNSFRAQSPVALAVLQGGQS